MKTDPPPKCERTAATDAFFEAFRAEAGLPAGTGYVVSAFGDSAKMADELADLVLHGPKRATASLRRDFHDDGGPLPRVGDHVVVIDGAGKPRLIWRTTDVQIKPFREVDAAFAWDEGEGDRTLADWLRLHRAYFTRDAARRGYTFDEGIETVFERFAVIWPPEHAD